MTLVEAELPKARKGRIDLVDIPEHLFASIDGTGAPQEGGFQASIGALYTVAYGIRFATAKEDRVKVSALEALWWSDARTNGHLADPADWSWRALIRLPWGTDEVAVDQARQAGMERHPELSGPLELVRFGPWREGLCVQTLHVGPYRTEPETVARMRDFMAVHGYVAAGAHHEIYLGHPLRSAPDRLRTVLRQPVAPAR